VSPELLWLWEKDSLGAQEGELLLLEAGIRGLVRDSRPRRPSACVKNCREIVWNSNSAVDCKNLKI
jgi:hypothetical protein